MKGSRVGTVLRSALMFALFLSSTASFVSCGKKGDGDGITATESTNTNEDTRTDAEREEDRIKRITAMNALESQEEFSTFIKLMEKHGAQEALMQAEKITLFAPTNTAFNALGSNQMTKLEEDPEAFNELLETMSVEGSFKLEDLRPLERIKNREGVIVSVERANGYIWIEGSPIMLSDIPFRNGIIHGVDIIYER